MEKNQFNNIMDNLDFLINQCEFEVGNLHSGNDVDNLTLKELRLKAEKCRDILSDMTKVLTTELYHIIGMGSLTCVQESSFTSKIKLLCTYRPDIQYMASIAVPPTPKLPAKTSYKLTVLSDVKLTSSSEDRLKKQVK